MDNRNNNSPISKMRSAEQKNWFTREEIGQIRERARSLGVPTIAESAKGAIDSFFGDSRGIGGLEESIKNFFRNNGNLCNEVSILTKHGDYNIVKRDGDFRMNGKNVGPNVSSVLNMML